MNKIFLIVAALLAPAMLRAQTFVPVLNGKAIVDATTGGVSQPSSFKVFLTANATFSIINGAPGQTIHVMFAEDSVGGWTVSFASNISTPCSVAVGANTYTNCGFTFDPGNNTWAGFGGTGGGGGGLSGQTPGQVPIAATTTTSTSSKNIQGTGTNLLSADGAGATGNPLCRDASGGATTSTCVPPLSGQTAGQVTIAATATTSTSTKPIQGATDPNVMGAGTVSGVATNLCTDANGGATTTGCPTGGNPASPNFQTQVYNSGAFASTPCFNVTAPTSASAIGQLDCDSRPKGPNPSIDIRAYNARSVAPGSVATATATYTNGSPNMTLSAASTFQNGDWVVVYGAGTSTVNTPSAPAVTAVNAASQTMTLFDVAGTGGGTQYCYQLLSRTFLGGTSVSTETCTNVGSTTLGLQTATITTVSLANNIATYTTNAAHRLTVGSIVRIVGTTTLEVSGTIFDGWSIVQTVPDNTHFTTWLTSDTKAGAIAAGTGGTVNYWSGNHIVAAATTNNYQYYIYGRVTGGTKTLIGIMQPQPFGTTCAALFPLGDLGTCLAFDDFGTGVLTGAPGVPSYIPGVVPGAGTTRDMLLTQIVSGAGTTSITVANNANVNSSGTILFDDAQALLAAWNAGGAQGGQGSITIPSTANTTTQFVFNAPIQISNIGGGSRPNIQQNGDIRLNEPIVFSTYAKWTGIPGGTQVTPGFSQQVQPLIAVNNASPGIYVVNGIDLFLINVNMAELNTNSAVAYMQDNGSGLFREVTWTQNTAFTHSNISAVFRSGFLFNFFNTTLATSQNGPFTGYADSTPGIHLNQAGDPRFDNLFISGAGVTFFPINAGAGSYVDINQLYCQGCYMPFFSIEGGGGSNIWGRVRNAISDTTFDGPIIINTSGNAMFFTGDTGFPGINSIGGSAGSTINNNEITAFQFPGRRGSGGNGNFEHGSRYNVNDGTFGRVQLGVDAISRSFQLGQGYSLFTGTAAYTAPNCVVSAGGSLTVGAWFIYYAPIFNWDGSEGTPSQYCMVTTTGGNQTITATAPASVPGALLTAWYAAPANLNSFAFCFNTSINSAVISNNAGCANGSPALAASGGPAGIKNGIVSGQTVQVGLTATTSSAVAQEPAVFPDNTTGGIVPVTGYQNSIFDDFNRASLNTSGPCASGSCWTAINPPNTLPTITSNQITGGTLNTWTGAYWNANTFYPDQYASNYQAAFGVGGGDVLPMVRYNTSLNKGYTCDGNINVVNFGNNTQVAIATGLTINNGDTLWCEAHGTTITAYDITSGSSITATDSTIATGSPGIAIFSNAANFADNFAAGNYRPITQADMVHNWKQPQHFPAITVGTSAPIPGALPNGYIESSQNEFLGLASAPANPASGDCKEYFDSVAGILKAINSSGVNCFPLSTTNNALQFSLAYYSASGTNNTLSGVNGPTTPNNVPQFWTTTPSGGVATAPAPSLAGVAANVQSGTSYTVVATDRAGLITLSNGSPIAITLPQAGTAGFANNFITEICNIGTGQATITPTTSTIAVITGSQYIAPAASFVMTTGQCSWIYSDNTNYTALRFSQGGTATIASGTAGLSTTLITAGTCSAAQTFSAPGTLTTDALEFTPNTDPTVVSSYGPSTSGSLYIWPYVTANNVNFKVCSNSASNLTPGALSVNWKVLR